ncbi:asparaginase [Plantibacter flavus]|uniref:asparaginase n=1 Tax=Plantibacter flavus TaxID=150123 RepID=UPI003F16BE08
MPRIVILATGGTIASRVDEHGAAVASDAAAQLLHGLDRELEGIEVEAVDVLRKNSFNLTLGDLRLIVEAVGHQLARPDIDGIVVTHGTDTVEETAFLADLVHADPRPLVFTGAQRAADQAATDGPANLRDAILLAASPVAREMGVLVSFAGEVFAARGVRKMHSLEMAPFASAGTGPLGHVRDGRVDIRLRPVRLPARALPSSAFDTVRVDALLTYPGADESLFHAAIRSGASGIVVIGSGTGNPNSAIVTAIGEATADGVVVALASRAGDGPVVPIYGGGGAVDARDAGAVPTGDLPWSQVRILLALLLSESGDPAVVRDEIARYCSPDATLPEPVEGPAPVRTPAGSAAGTSTPLPDSTPLSELIDGPSALRPAR